MLTIRTEKESKSNIRVLTFDGEWDIYEKARAKGYFSQAVAEVPRGVIVDVTDVSILDSSGIEVLIASFTKLRDAGVPMVIVVDHNNYVIRKFRNLGIFEGTGLSFYETVEEAESAITGT